LMCPIAHPHADLLVEGISAKIFRDRGNIDSLCG
jgi:hypothetical protein